jgi:hypothetical protein
LSMKSINSFQSALTTWLALLNWASPLGAMVGALKVAMVVVADLGTCTKLPAKATTVF